MRTSHFNTELLNLQYNLKRFAIMLTKNEEDAKDLMQETFLKALVNRDRYQDGTNLKAWVFTIMKNTFINNFRKSTKRYVVLDDSDNQYLLNSYFTKTTPDLDLIHNEINHRIDQLAPKFRNPLLLHSAGYKYEEIAEAMNLKIGTVKSRIFWSRQKLKVVFDDNKENT